MKLLYLAAGVASAAAAVPAQAQMRTDPAIIAEQKAAIAKLDKLRGEWRGTATITGPGGTLKLVQTERAGPMLDGTVMVVEGRGTDEAGKLVFNAFAVISYDAATDQYAMSSWTDGRSGKFPFAVTDKGFDWSVPLPNGATIRYSATLADGKWVEIGSYVGQGMPPVEFAKLDVQRIGDTDWPAAGAVGPQ
jgi:hypothetical protein